MFVTGVQTCALRSRGGGGSHTNIHFQVNQTGSSTAGGGGRGEGRGGFKEEEEQFSPLLLSPGGLSRVLSVQQDEGLQLLGDAALVRQAVRDDGTGSQTLQGGVVDGLDQVLGHLLLVQQVTGRLPEGVGAVEVRAARDQQVHDVGLVVGRRHVQRAVVVFVAGVDVGAALQQDGCDLQGGELADWVAAYAGGVAVHSQVERAVATLTTWLQLQEPGTHTHHTRQLCKTSRDKTQTS